MTEAEWNACSDPLLLLQFLRGAVTDRKLRLFICGWLRAEWDSLVDDQSRNAVVTAERFADGQATLDELDAARKAAQAALLFWQESGGIPDTISEYEYNFGHAMRDLAAAAAGRDAWSAAYHVAERVQGENQADLIRCIFGNVFSHEANAPDCREIPIIASARKIYDERSFDDLPILADALEKAGCKNLNLLAHLREPGPHVRGCWALDLVLAMS